MRNKFLSTLISSILAFLLTAPTVLAAVPIAVNSGQEDSFVFDENDTELLDFVDADTEDVEEFLSTIQLRLTEENELLIYGNSTTTYDLKLYLSEEESVTIDEAGDFSILIELSGNEEKILNLDLLEEEEVIFESKFELSLLLEKLTIPSEEETIEKTNPNAEEVEDNGSEDPDEADEANSEGQENEPFEEEIETSDSETVSENDEGAAGKDDEIEEGEEIQQFSQMQILSSANRISGGIDVNYRTIVGAGGFSIDSLPWGSPGYQRIGSTTDYRGQEVRVVQETRNGEYVLIEQNSNLIGWVDRRSLRMPQIGNPNHSTQVDYPVSITSGGYTVDTLPWGTAGYQRMTSTSNYSGQQVNAIRETNNRNYILLESTDGALIGWVDRRAVTPAAQRIQNGRDLNQLTVVGAGGFTIDSLPWGTSGAQRIGSTTDYRNQEVRVVQETHNGEYVLIEQNSNLIGWVDRRSLRMPQVGNPNQSSEVYFEVTINSGGYSLDTLPWGTPGYQRIGSTSDYINQEAIAVRQTNNGNYLLLEMNNQLIGWVDSRAVERSYEVGVVANAFEVDYNATINSGGYSIDTLPWGTSDYERITWSQHYIGSNVNVTHEFGAYALIELDGTPLGWVDRSALNYVPRPGTPNNASNANYSAHLRSGYTIDTLPWGQSGHQRISRTNFYENEEVRVLSHAGNYALIQINGRNLGWVDRRALRLPVIYIDPGHGGSDSGATAQGVREATLNLQVANILNRILQGRNYETVISRNSDQTVELSERVAEANNLNTDIFVSIHFNAMGGANAGTARGIETFIFHRRPQGGLYQETNRNNFNTNDPRIAESLRLADQIHPALINRTGLNNRGVKGNNFHVLRETNMPAVLLELGFMDNPTELQIVRSQQFQENAARAIADGIDRYFGR